MKVLYVGYSAPPVGGSLIETLSVNRFCSGSLCENKLTIDLDGSRLNKDKLKKILQKSGNDIICRISNSDRINDLIKYFDKIHYYSRDVTFNIFHTLQLILTSEDRDKVYVHLLKWKPSARVLLKWIISNISFDDDENVYWLQQIDRYTEIVNPKILWQMFALINPEYSPFQRYRYKFKKVGVENNE